jgi:UDP-N-acetyl-2-amino-2-deoxyglucuronate dehydrogenase
MINPVQPSRDVPIRIALVGCGRISRNHIKAMALLQHRCELVAICDPQQHRLDEAQALIAGFADQDKCRMTPPRQFQDYGDLIEAAVQGHWPVDLIVLATPSGLHASQVIAAAEAGLHVITEKPLATRWCDGVAMVKACQQMGVHLFVVKQNRLNSTLQLVRRQLQAGRFGRLAMVVVNVFWQRPQSYYDQEAWRGTWEQDGGALMNQASHYVDLLDWLVGPVASMSASIATLGRCIEVEDTAALQIRWCNGALGTMAVTMLTYPKNLEGSITLLGDSGSVRIGGPAVNRIEHWSFADSHPDDDLVAEASEATTSVYGFGHYSYYSNVLATLEGKETAVCDGEAGLRCLELLAAAYQSAQQNRTIELPLQS